MQIKDTEASKAMKRTRSKGKKHRKDIRQYMRLCKGKYQGGLSRKIIAEYEAIHGKGHRRKECES